MMKVLVVCEKAAASRRIAQILSEGQPERKKLGSVLAYSFQKGSDEYTVVGLRGHIIKLDFDRKLNNWSSVSPLKLIHSDPIKKISEAAIAKTLDRLVPEMDEIIIATDFDREGELIGVEALEVTNIHPDKERPDKDTAGGKTIKRARFSSLTHAEIVHAFEKLEDVDYRLAKAAEARQVVDLTWGAVLTRLISLASGQKGKAFLSAGRVQSPTLSLVVDRDREIREFIPQPFWNIKAELKSDSPFIATHIDQPFWEKEQADGVFKRAVKAKWGKVVEYREEEKKDYPPSPFDTTTFLMEANKLGISPARAMKIAEDLYTSGYISYPRTDNTVYPHGLGLKYILEKLVKSDLGDMAVELLKQEKLVPSRGKKRTTDHPPIHPTAAAKKGKLKAEKWKIYELIVRRFYATLAPPALVKKTSVSLDLEGEVFKASGKESVEAGWRKYYPYYQFKENRLPSLKNGEMVDVLAVTMDEEETKPPSRYSQASLLKEMEKRHLGTKSTRHDIIQKLYDRKYVQGNNLVPTLTGRAVIEALEEHARVITTSDMTATLEKDMDGIAAGKRRFEEVIEESREMLEVAAEAIEKNRDKIGEDIRKAMREQQYIGKCPKCGGDLIIIKTKKGTQFIGCSNYPDCDVTRPIPQGILVVPGDRECELCGSPTVKIIGKGASPIEICINPECPNSKKNLTAGKCPKCGSDLVIRYSRRGKRFLGCSAYPKCTQSYPLPQRGKIEFTGRACPSCGAPIIKLIMKGRRPMEMCVNPECPAKKKGDKKGKKA